MTARGSLRIARLRSGKPAAPAPAVADGGGAEVVVENAVKTYGRVHALRGVSLSVTPGEFVAVTGPSGSGKSTLLNLIGTLDQPDSGTITVAGRPLPSPRDAVQFRRHLVGFVFQDNLLLAYLSAQGNVETALLARGLSREDRRARSQALLEEVGLSGRVGHLPSELSSGERQRVALARALANDPRLLLADEPTGALDSASTDRILALLAATRERHGMTIIVASHDPVVTERADREVRLIDGTVQPS